jgi:hypothetical protein
MTAALSLLARNLPLLNHATHAKAAIFEQGAA